MAAIIGGKSHCVEFIFLWQRSIIRLLDGNMFQWIDEDEWLDQRRKGIGGSEASMVLGINPWKSKMELWTEKVTQVSKIDATKQLMFKVGKTLEPIIAEEYENTTGRKLEERPLKIHSQYPFILGNIDREIVDTPKPGILEIKTKGSQTNWHGEDIPIYYQVQLQHYLNLYNYSWGSFAILNLGRMELKIIDVQRDDELISRIMKEEINFWQLVENKIPPSVDGSQTCHDFLREKYKIGEDITIDLSENEDVSKWISNLKEIREKTKLLETEELESKNRLMEIMGSAERCIGKDYSILWKSPKDKEIFELEKFKLEHPELAKNYIRKEHQTRRFIIRFTKERPQIMQKGDNANDRKLLRLIPKEEVMDKN